LSAAAAKRRKRDSQEKERATGLWVDPAHLPNAKQFARFNLSPEEAGYNRLLELADIALGTSKSKPKPFVERRKNKGKPFMGIERRSTR